MSKHSRAPVRVGVAGWDYRDWKGIVYPDPRPRGFDRLSCLSGYLDLIEINSTFYGPARTAVARKWVKRVNDVEGFRCDDVRARGRLRCLPLAAGDRIFNP